jgi:hypothetical protein
MMIRDRLERQIEIEAFHARPGVPIVTYLGYVAQRIRERGWVDLKMSKEAKKPSTAVAAWRAWRQISVMEKDIQEMGRDLDDDVGRHEKISNLIWKVDMSSPRRSDVARAKEDLALVRDRLAGLPKRTLRQDRLLAVIASGHASGSDIHRAASVCVRADRIRSEQLQESDDDCFLTD